MSKRRKLPFWMRRRVSCGDCGYIFLEDDKHRYMQEYFNCPRCDRRFSYEEFCEENEFKWDWKRAVLNEYE